MTVVAATITLSDIANAKSVSKAIGKSGARACRTSCAQGLKTCLRELRAERTSCAAGDRTARKACRARQRVVSKAGKRSCRGYRTRCRTCCRTGGAACAVTPEAPRLEGAFPALDRSALARTTLPRAADGSAVALALPDGDLVVDVAAPRTPISAAAECSAALLACFAPPARNVAGCFAGVPVCASDTPWQTDGPMCCPAGCADRYQELRRAGQSGPEAFARAIWESPSCMPGFAGLPPMETQP